LSNPQIDWCYEPSSELSGDTLGYFQIDDTKVAVYVIDVCGHGVGAALLSTSVANQMRAWPSELADPCNPSELLAALNRMYPMEKHGERFFTIWYGVHDAAEGVLRYASAGAPPALLLSESGPKLLGKPALPIGCFEQFWVTTHAEQIRSGERLLVFSDGVYEVEGESGQLGLKSFCSRASEGDDPDELLSFVREKSLNTRLPDDFTLLRVRF
jgi:sigma-B regulation protein RsbU (phosphoserine phosphatase)